MARRAITVMACVYDVQYIHGEDVGHADAMSRVRFEDDRNDLVPTFAATFEKLVIDFNFM